MATSKATPPVELHNVTKNYGSVQALKHVSLTVERGEVVAVLGPNGAGKSTSIALMLGMRRPTSGSVTLFGENPRQANHRKRVGVMLQESGVPESLTVHELVELFGRFHDNPMVTQEAIKMAGLEGKAKSRLGRLSGGQKQRVYFALALVGGKHVRFRVSNLTREELRQLIQAEVSPLPGNKFELFTKEPEAVLATLFKQGAQLSDLEVVGAGLEEAFLTLTSNGKHAA